MSGLGFNQRPSGNGLGTTAHAAEHAALTYKIPYLKYRSGFPYGKAAPGTIATNGVVTLTIALQTTYSGGIWLHFPAGAVVGGSEGMYWVVMSSTTAGQVYTNFHDPATEFFPYLPTGTPVAAVGSNSAYSPTLAETTICNMTIAANEISTSGGFRLRANFNGSGANVKTPRGRLAGTTTINPATVTSAGNGFSHTVMARGANRQYASNAGGGDVGTAGAQVYTAADSTVAMPYTLTVQMTTAAENFVVESSDLTILP